MFFRDIWRKVDTNGLDWFKEEDVSKWRMKLNIPGGMSRRGPKRKVMDVGGWCERGGWRG